MNNKKWSFAARLFSLSVVSLMAQSTAVGNPEAQAAQMEALKKSVAETAYSALVVHTKVEIVPLSVRSPNPKRSAVAEDSSEERHVYHARVLETFKGKASATIRYETVVEQGESASVDSKPIVVTLCRGSRGFYWPGVGTSFPGEDKMIAEARRAAKQPAAHAKKLPGSLCD